MDHVASKRDTTSEATVFEMANRCKGLVLDQRAAVGTAAAALGRQVLASMDSADEWAVALRRLALRVPRELNSG